MRPDRKEIVVPEDLPLPISVADRRVVITGASRGLGRVLAIAFARAGATVGLVARDEERLAKVAADLPGTHLLFAGDVRDEQFNQDVAERMCSERGRLDVWIANAGISPVMQTAEELLGTTWQDVLETNASGAFYGAKAAQTVMADGGRIIFTSSVIGQRSMAGLAAYASSKAAMESLVRTLALEVGPLGITVNAIALGWFDSPLASAFRARDEIDGAIVNHTALRRWGSPHDLPGAYLFLASAASQFITGAVIPVDGGYLLT